MLIDINKVFITKMETKRNQNTEQTRSLTSCWGKVVLTLPIGLSQDRQQKQCLI